MHKPTLLASLCVALFATTSRADILRFTTGYPSQAATAGNPGLVSGAAFVPSISYALTAIELTITERTRIDQFAVVGNTPTPGLYPFSVMVHSSLAAFAASPLNGDIYSSTAWNINSEESFGSGAGVGGMAWNYYTLVNPLGAEIFLDPGTYAITIYRDTNWRFADSDIDLGTDWLVGNQTPGEIFAWQEFRPSGTAAIDVYGTVLTPPDRLCADQNEDGLVTPSDFSAWIANFNAQSLIGDVNQDALVTAADFSAWIAAFNQGENGPTCVP